MDKAMLIEMIGYLGSALVVVSMLMSSVIKLRIINAVGSCIFTAYALIIHSYPTAFMNFCLIVINGYNLVKLLRDSRQYDLVETDADDAFVGYFLEHFRDDIKVHFPDFRPGNYDAVYLVMCSSNPAGILLGSRRGEGSIDVELDYTTPVYRDCSAGKFLYGELAKRSVRRLSCSAGGDKHEAYLKKMGFREEQGMFVKDLGTA